MVKKHHDTPLLNKNILISNLKEKANSFSASCSQVYITDEKLLPVTIDNQELLTKIRSLKFMDMMIDLLA